MRIYKDQSNRTVGSVLCLQAANPGSNLGIFGSQKPAKSD